MAESSRDKLLKQFRELVQERLERINQGLMTLESGPNTDLGKGAIRALQQARGAFLRGVLLLHLFEYADAARAFREAERADPGFAMAYWGEAMTHDHPVWNEEDPEAARAALERLAPTPAARQQKAPTARERGYLGAVERLWGEGSKERRDSLYSQAMGRLLAAVALVLAVGH